NSVFFWKKGDPGIYRVLIDASSRGPEKIGDQASLFSMAAIDDDKITIVNNDDPRVWKVRLINVHGAMTELASIPEVSIVAAASDFFAYVESSGRITVIEIETGKRTPIPIEFEPAELTSLYVTAREIITTHAYTHAIRFHGPPV
nr:hypothetical protein [Candidatus Sigynarchaeota archaeon]